MWFQVMPQEVLIGYYEEFLHGEDGQALELDVHGVVESPPLERCELCTEENSLVVDSIAQVDG